MYGAKVVAPNAQVVDARESLAFRNAVGLAVLVETCETVIGADSRAARIWAKEAGQEPVVKGPMAKGKAEEQCSETLDRSG